MSLSLHLISSLICDSLDFVFCFSKRTVLSRQGETAFPSIFVVVQGSFPFLSHTEDTRHPWHCSSLRSVKSLIPQDSRFKKLSTDKKGKDVLSM